MARRVSTFLRVHWDLPVVCVIVALSFLLDLTWLAGSHYPPVGDESIHLENVLQLGRGWVPSPQGLVASHYPPLTYLVTHAFFLTFGVSIHVAHLSIAAIYGAFVVATALLGRTAAGPRGSVVLAVAAAGNPFARFYSHRYFVDLALAAAVAVSFAALFSSDGYTRPRSCVYLGAGIVLGMLAKWTFVTVYTVPALISVIPIFRRANPAERRLIASALLLTGITAGSLLLHALAHRGTVDTSVVGVAMVDSTLWVGLLFWAWRTRRRNARPACWSASSGFVLSLSVGILGMLPWYVVGTESLPAVIGVNYLNVRAPFWVQLGDYAWCLLRMTWAGPLWFVLGAAIGLRSRHLRWTVMLSLVGLCAAVTLASYSTRIDGRYVLPMLPLLLYGTFAWLAIDRRVWLAGLTVLTALSVLQSAWWLPVFQPWAPMVAAVEVPSWGQTYAARASYFSTVPGVPPPVTDEYPYALIVRILKDNRIRRLRLMRWRTSEVRNLLQVYADFMQADLYVMWPDEPLPASLQPATAIMVPTDDGRPAVPIPLGFRHVGHWRETVRAEPDARLPWYLDLYLPPRSAL